MESTPKLPNLPRLSKPYYRIGEVSKMLGLHSYVLRFWGDDFAQWVRTERSGKGQRIYDRQSVVTLALIHDLINVELYTHAGVKRQLERLHETQKASA